MNAKKIALKGIGGLLIGCSLISYGVISEERMMLPSTDTRSKTEKAIANVIKDDHIASVIAKTKYPLTIAAIKYVETADAGPNIYGDNGRSYGLYQIQKSVWGEFDKDIQGQTDKVEEILDKLIKDKGYYEAIRAYNGSGSKANKYRQKVFMVMSKLRKEANA